MLLRQHRFLIVVHEKVFIAFFMGRPETLPALGRERTVYNNLTLHSKQHPSSHRCCTTWPVLTSPAEHPRLCKPGDVRRRSWALKLKHPSYKSSGMALLSQTITRYSCKVSVGKENFQEAILVPSPCFGVSESLTVRIWVFLCFLASVLKTGPRRF